MGTKKPVRRKGIQINPSASQTNLAPGYWGNHGPKPRVLTDQVIERITRLNKDFLDLGFLVDLWVFPEFKLTADCDGVHLGDALLCSCVKQTNQSADQECVKCYGTKYVPGFIKWGFNTIFFSAIDPVLALPPSLTIDTTTTQHMIKLAPGYTNGILESRDFSVTNPCSNEFTMDIKAYVRGKAGNYLKVEYSIDRGVTWRDDDMTNLHLSQGTVRFRVTFYRVSINDISPAFEILRVRHPIQREPYVKVAYPMGTHKKKRETMGVVDDTSGIEYWTIPLIGSAQVNGVVAYNRPVISERSFIEIKEGTFHGDRMITVQHRRSEHIGVLTSQWFSARRAQPDETYNIIF